MLISKSRFHKPYQQNIYVNGKLKTVIDAKNAPTEEVIPDETE